MVIIKRRKRTLALMQNDDDKLILDYLFGKTDGVYQGEIMATENEVKEVFYDACLITESQNWCTIKWSKEENKFGYWSEDYDRQGDYEATDSYAVINLADAQLVDDLSSFPHTEIVINN